MSEMSEEEFIRQCRLDWDSPGIETIKDALELAYMNGDYHDIGGNVEAPTGHYYYMERWVVVTDDQGNTVVTAHPNSHEAEIHFNELEKEYDRWIRDEIL